MIYALFKLKFISETDNGIEFECQCQINYGPEMNVEFSIPIQIPYSYFSDFEALRMIDSTRQNFLI